MELEVLFDELGYYFDAIEEAIEIEVDHLNRPHYLGHLAMIARIFVAARRGPDIDQLSKILNVERRSNIQMLPGKPAAAVRNAWTRLLPVLEDFIGSHS
jgi:hypothetical protein